MSRTFRFLVRGLAVAPLLLAAACGLETSGVGSGDADTGLPEVGDGDTVLPDDGADETTPTEDAGEVPDTPAVCGNGITEAPEECDDGDPDDTDECPTTCRAATCGDGFVRTGLEDCDDGPDNSDTTPNACRNDCVAPGCGDGVVDTGEACDDGNRVDDDACRNDCRLPGCGNGIVNSGEECDDGDLDNTDDCLTTCVAASCGDGYLQAGVEECDGDSTTCDTGCGSTGRRDCIACVWSTSCAPPVETCNGADDDCDGVADDGFACRAGEPAPCTTFCGSTGTGTCSAGCLPADPALCAAPAEACNGADDDCDGTTDEGFPLFCNLPGGHPAVDLCVDPGETPCNGVDDNCNGTIDEGSECVPGLSRTCTNTCGVAGNQTCTSACGWGPCCGATEVCQPLGSTACDDDCDGTTDEGCGIVAPPNDTCATATVLTAAGVIHGDTTSATNTAAPSCSGGTGRDLWYTFTLSGRRIVYLDTIDGGSWSSVLEVRSGACPGAGVATGCNDDACGGDRSQLLLTLEAGTYYILVDGHDDSHHGPFDLLFQASSCVVPRITRNGDNDGSTVSTSGSSLDSACGGGSASEYVYYFALCAPATVTAHTCATRTNFDTVLYYRTGSCWDGNPELTCNDDSSCASYSLASRITAELPRGLSFVVVDGRGGAEGNFRLNIAGLP